MKPKGGTRPGAGRKTLDYTKHGIPKLIYLYPKHIQFLLHENASELIRGLLDAEIAKRQEIVRQQEQENLKNVWRPL